jgi:serine protease
MKRFGSVSIFALGATLALAACQQDATAPVASPARGPSKTVISDGGGQYVVLFKSNAVPSDFAAQVAALGGSIVYAHGPTGFALLRGIDDSGAAQIGQLSSVAEVQGDLTFTIDQPVAPAEADAGDAIQSQANPAAALRYSFQWNMRLIHAPAAWAAGKLGSPGVTVAILDTGIDYDAPDLNGLVDLSRSVSFVASDNAISSTYFPTRNAISDYNGHGTNVATQVSSKAFALAGVTSRTTLIGVKVLGAAGSGSLGNVLAGVLWAADHGADVANMSLGGGFDRHGNQDIIHAIDRVFNYAKKQGVVMVVSAGNSASDLDHNGSLFVTYCDATHVVCVSSVGPVLPTGSGDIPSFYTNFGKNSIDVAGPGGNAGSTVAAWPWGNDAVSWVWSYCSKTRIARFTGAGVPILTACVAGNRLTGYIGTSQAAPHVAGLAALLVAEEGHGKPNQIKHDLEKSAVGPNGKDTYLGRGRIDVARALGL